VQAVVAGLMARTSAASPRITPDSNRREINQLKLQRQSRPWVRPTITSCIIHRV